MVGPGNLGAADRGDPDPAGVRYARHWEPVLAPAGARLLARVAARSAPTTGSAPLAERSAPAAVLDLGTGTGSLARAAAARWTGARVVGLDASASMLSVARRATASSASDLGLGPGLGQTEWIVADAAAMPLADASVDVVLSAFMLHLVSDRRAVLREVARVLRPAGILGVVTWLADDTLMAPDVEFDEAVYDLGLDDPEADEEGQPAVDIASPEEFRSDLAACGFDDVDARPDRLVHAWTREAYLDFKADYDEWDLFASLSATDRARLRERLVARWASLRAEAFTLRAPLVMATACRQAAKGDISRGRQTRQGW